MNNLNVFGRSISNSRTSNPTGKYERDRLYIQRQTVSVSEGREKILSTVLRLVAEITFHRRVH